MLRWKESFFIILCFLLVSPILIVFGVKVNELDYPIGKEQGIDSSSSISADTLQRILVGVEKGNKENIYFYGLLKLYGISMNVDVHGAAQQFLRASKLGHKDATTAYGTLHLGSLGPPNYMEAMKYFREGVTLGDMNAHWLLGQMLLDGKGVPPAPVEAALHFQRAADANVPQAQHSLAVMYEYGKGIEVNYDLAISYYKRAAEQQYVESMYHLALMHAYGRGMQQDFYQARSLLETAANQFNHAPSMYYIGVFKTYGYGCAINYEQAIHWFERAIGVDDPRVNSKSIEAADELKRLVYEAKGHNEELLNEMQRRAQREDG